jgi:hypothetical protein
MTSRILALALIAFLAPACASDKQPADMPHEPLARIEVEDADGVVSDIELQAIDSRVGITRAVLEVEGLRYTLQLDASTASVLDEAGNRLVHAERAFGATRLSSDSGAHLETASGPIILTESDAAAFEPHALVLLSDEVIATVERVAPRGTSGTPSPSYVAYAGECSSTYRDYCVVRFITGGVCAAACASGFDSWCRGCLGDRCVDCLGLVGGGGSSWGAGVRGAWVNETCAFNWSTQSWSGSWCFYKGTQRLSCKTGPCWPG